MDDCSLWIGPRADQSISRQEREGVTGDARSSGKEISRAEVREDNTRLSDVVLSIDVMQRLADYFLVVGYDHDEERGGRSCGKIIQRFPDKDWPDCPFNPRIIHFCQPQGWMLTPKHELPTFFISILTDLDGLRHYCACLTFHQTLLPTTTTATTTTTAINSFFKKSNVYSDEADDTAFLLPRTQMYAPKCLVLTSKLDCFEAFRVSLTGIPIDISPSLLVELPWYCLHHVCRADVRYSNRNGGWQHSWQRQCATCRYV